MDVSVENPGLDVAQNHLLAPVFELHHTTIGLRLMTNIAGLERSSRPRESRK